MRHQDRPAHDTARNVGHVYRRRFWPEAADQLSWRGVGPPAALEDLATHRAGHHVLRLRPVGLAVPDGPLVHRVCPRRRNHSGHHAQESDEPAVRAYGCSRRKTLPPSAKCCRWPQGRGAQVPLAQTVGYSVGGKSGTAHKQVGKGYASNKYRCLVYRHGSRSTSRASSSP